MTDSNLAVSIKQAFGTSSLQINRVLEVTHDRHPVDIAEAISGLKPIEVMKVLAALEPAKAGAVLSQLELQILKPLLNDLEGEQIARALARIPSNDAAWVIGQTGVERQSALIAAVATHSTQMAQEIRELLNYPEGSVGRLMTKHFVRLTENLTVGETFEAIRRIEHEVETLTDLYIVDDEAPERLVGVVSLRELTRAQSSDTLAQIMTRNVISVTVDTKQEDVAKIISKYDFLALPVLDRDNALVGIVTVDDVLDVLVTRSRDDQLRFGAVEPGVLNQPYFSTSIFRVVRSRVGWLILLFVAETLTGSVLRLFESELATVVALSFFIPLLIGTGGNTGAQTVSTIIRGLALKEIESKDLFKVLLRELLGGLLIGLGLGIVAFFRSRLWGSEIQLSLVVGLTILVICTWANTVGSLIPMLALKLKIDPALVSAPLITTLVDATGLAIYLSIAKLLLPELR